MIDQHTFSSQLSELLKRPEFKLPLTGQDDLETQLRNLFRSYEAAVAALDPSADKAVEYVHQNMPQLSKLIVSLLSTIRHQLDGMWNVAFRRFEEGIDAVRPWVVLSRQAYARSRLQDEALEGPWCPPLYRLRVGDIDKAYPRGELFCIPFDKRDRVGLQRFSLPGLPCLYTSRSTFTAWEELGRPALHSLWVSQIRATCPVNMFAIPTTQRVAGSIELKPDVGPWITLHTMTMLWPLYAACLICRRESKSKGFVQEYIVPQMLLEWIVTHQKGGDVKKPDEPDKDMVVFDGIVYPSTRTYAKTNSPLEENFVFPVRTSSVSGPCSILKDMFELTSPITWQLAVSMEEEEQHAIPNDRYNGRLRLPGTSFLYILSDFARVESITDRLEFARI